YFSYFADELNQMKKPFLATLFSLTSHHPYKVPNEFIDKFDKGSLAIHQTIGYTDFSLKQFFEKASTFDWFDNTLFIITADHTQKLTTQKFQNVVGNYRIPIYFYHPKVNLKKYNDQKIVSQ